MIHEVPATDNEVTLVSRKHWRSGVDTLFINRAAVKPLFLLIVQQIIVASSTFWLTHLAIAAKVGNGFVGWLALYLGSLLLPYIPGSLLCYQLERWSIACQFRLIELSDLLLYGQPLLWQDGEHKKFALPIYSKEGPKLIENTVHYAYSLASCTLNTTFNILAVAIAVDPYLLLSYLAGICLGAILVRLQSRKNEYLSENTERLRVALSNEQLFMWDNTVIGNQYNRGLWYDRLLSAFTAARRAALRSEAFNQTVAVGIVLVTQLPIFGYVAWSLLSRSAEPDYVISVIVVLPRLFQVVNSSHAILALVAMWYSQRGKLSVLRTLFGAQRSEPIGVVQYDKIFVNGSPLASICHNVGEFVSQLRTPGRFTVTGPNGSGKTTLLLLAKALLGNHGYFLPAQHSLSFSRKSERLSTGQTMLTIMDELCEQARIEVLLLDEWDANLDAANRAVVDSQLAALPSRGITVVEVRHDGSWFS
jgi:hypothetical protein